MKNKLQELADFLDDKINQMNKHFPFLDDVEKENSFEYFLCESCDEYIHGSKIMWYNDIPVCPKCETRINL